MALFQKKPDISSNLPLYTLGSNKTALIIGLGNPDKKYDNTRHNLGFLVIDEFAKRNDFPTWTLKKDLKAVVSVANLGDTRVILAKPQTYIYNQNTLVAYDEIALNFGQIRTRLGGTDAGHNGVKSLTQHLGDDFGRLRVGIANEISQKADTANFVLGKFSPEEQADLTPIIKEACAIITEYVFSGDLPHETRSVL
jgi:PTH1 family peptidyl-tRNA hydrolase